MTISAVGQLGLGIGTDTATLGPTPSVGDLLVLYYADGASALTAVSGAGVATWNIRTTGNAAIAWGIVTTAGVGDITVTNADANYAGTLFSVEEYAGDVNGSWVLDAGGGTSSTGTTGSFPALTAAGTEDLYLGAASCATTGVAGSDISFLDNSVGTGPSLAWIWDTAASAPTTYTPTWTTNGVSATVDTVGVLVTFVPLAASGSLRASFSASLAPTVYVSTSALVAKFTGSLISSGGFAPADLVPWLLPVAINDHAYLMDFAKTRITTLQVRRMSSDNSVEPGEQCVDETTEILTQRGWLLHTELRPGDTALTLNMKTGLSEWNVVEDVKRYERHDFPMWSMEGRGHSSLTTLTHRWPVERSVDHGKSGKSKEIVIKTSEELNTKHSIIAGADCASLPTEAKYTDELVELVAWFWTEGNVTCDHRKQKVRRVTIAQHPRVNPENVERIRASLTRAFGPEHRGVWYEYENPHNGVTLFHIHRGAFDEILDAAPNKVVRPDWLASLTKAQLELFIEVSVLADGWKQGRHIALSQASRERIDAFQFACVLAGRRANRIYEKAPMSSAGWRWKVSASDVRRKFNPIAAARKARAERTSNRQMVKSAFEVKTVKYDGIVWCPKTENETWCARRDGHVYFTGNTLSASGVWPRAQDNWFLGAGQEFLDNRFAFESVYVHSGEYPSVRTRFWKSQGINPWAEGKLTLHNEYAAIGTSPSNLRVIVCGNYLYRTDGADLYFTLSPVGVVSPTWTKVTTTNTNTITSLATDGSRVWFACGSQGVFITAAGATTVNAAATPAALANVGGLLLYSAGAGTLGSHLSAGSVTYGVTKVDAFGNETAAATASITVGTTPVNVNWNPDTVASSYKVYRGSLLVYNGTDPSFVDDGTVAGTTATVPSTNGTGSSAYPATWIFYGKGHLLGSTGRDLVEILASGSVSFIYQHENPDFTWTCATESPTAILVGGYAGSQSFVGAIQPDAANSGATLAPPTWATTMTNGEQINDIQYDAGAILMGTSLGIRSGTKPDSSGAFDVNPVIEEPGSVLSVSSWGQYMYFAWSNYDPTENWASRPTVAGLGRADLSQYTTPGVPAYATDVMGGTAGLTEQVVVMRGVPYFVVNDSGSYSLYGPDGKVVSSGWIEPGWIRYGTLENKILVEVDFQHEPLPSGASIEYQIVSETTTVVEDIATNSTAGTTTLTAPENAGLMEGDRYMPIITLHSTVVQDAGPVFHSHITKAMVTTKRNDEVLLALVWAEQIQGINDSWWQQDCYNEYLYLKGLESDGQIVNLTMGSLVKTAYIDQCLFEPAEHMTAQREWFMGTLTVKLITLD